MKKPPERMFRRLFLSLFQFVPRRLDLAAKFPRNGALPVVLPSRSGITKRVINKRHGNESSKRRDPWES
ncbi:MAG: hypothetical protein KF873_23625 [Gemmataceae bacterium]|nr:hypothetical protein [Gemmataceae bacterium]